ncbi:MAG TPA: hypothetical protein VFP78_14405 [Solirubrobacteraceae bacterium]|nr:hypothetical protein [Solirubrobacteraceae bacterium]
MALLVGHDALLRGAGLDLVDRPAQPGALALAGEQDRDDESGLVRAGDGE